MMKSKYTLPILLILATIGVTAYFQVKKAWDKVTFNYKNVKINFIQFITKQTQNITGSFDLVIKNDGAFTIKLSKIDINIIVDTYNIGKVKYDNDLLIEPYNMTTTTISFEYVPENSLQLINLLKTDIKSKDIVFIGKAYLVVGIVSIPIKINTSYKIGELL